MNPIVTFEMADGKSFKAELYPEKAPNTVNNFLSLVKKGFYDGLIFHRVIAGFMIQGGDPKGTGTGGPGYHIKGEFTHNGFKANDISHKRGVLSMARAQMPDSAGSQFFVMHGDGEYLDGEYAAFGKVIEGMETVDAIAAVIIGGTSMSGGRGSVIGSVLGMLILAVMNNLLNLIGVPPFLREAFKGIIVIGAVLLQKKEKAS